MDPSFIPVEVTPSKTPFALDQLRRSYKTALSAEAAIAAAPAVGAADEVFPNMFLVPISTPESAESATRIDLLYMGSLAGADGTPTLPAGKHDNASSVQSASSSKYSNGSTLTSPTTLQYYAPSNVLTYFSYGAPGTAEADPPAGDPIPITLTFGDTAFSVGGAISAEIAGLYVMQIVASMDSTEIVPGKYWQNVSRKTKVYTAFIATLPTGPFLTMANPGTGYTIGDTVTVAGSSGTATVVVDMVGGLIGGGSGIISYHVTLNTFTLAENLVPGSGGGTGSLWNNMMIP